MDYDFDLGTIQFLILNTTSPPRASAVAAIGDFQIVEQDVVFSLKTLGKNSGPKYTRSEVRCPGGTRGLPLSLKDCLIEYRSRTASKQAILHRPRVHRQQGCSLQTLSPYQAEKPSTLAKWPWRPWMGLVLIPAYTRLTAPDWPRHQAC